MRIGQRNDLPTIGGIGEDLLVTGHRRVEDDFADGLPFSTDRNALKYSPVLQSKNCGRTQQQSLLFKRISQIDSWTLGTLDAQKRKDIAFRLWIRRPFDDPP